MGLLIKYYSHAQENKLQKHKLEQKQAQTMHILLFELYKFQK